MLHIDEYRKMFAEKLTETMSLDAAFRKVIHRAYQHGFKEAKEEYTNDTTVT